MSALLLFLGSDVVIFLVWSVWDHIGLFVTSDLKWLWRHWSRTRSDILLSSCRGTRPDPLEPVTEHISPSPLVVSQTGSCCDVSDERSEWKIWTELCEYRYKTECSVITNTRLHTLQSRANQSSSSFILHVPGVHLMKCESITSPVSPRSVASRLN